MIAEGSRLMDPTKGLTPSGAKRARERFTEQIRVSNERIKELKEKREAVIARINAKIAREETYIQEANLVLQMLEDQWGEDYDGYEVDPDDEIIEHGKDTVQVIKKSGDYEIILYGTPVYE